MTTKAMQALQARATHRRTMSLFLHSTTKSNSHDAESSTPRITHTYDRPSKVLTHLPRQPN